MSPSEWKFDDDNGGGGDRRSVLKTQKRFTVHTRASSPDPRKYQLRAAESRSCAAASSAGAHYGIITRERARPGALSPRP